MRAIVVELRGSRAAALGTDGIVYLVDAKNRRIGQQVEVATARGSRWKRPFTWAACIAVLCAAATTGVCAAYSPYSYVSVDAAPSIEYTLNRFDQVLAVRAADESSGPVVTELNSEIRKFTHIDDAITHTVGQFYEDGYLTGTSDDYMLISVAAKCEHKKDELKKQIDSHIAEGPTAEVVDVSREDLHRAHELGTSAGRLTLLDRLYDDRKPGMQETREWMGQPAGEIYRAARGGKPPASPPEQHKEETSANPSL